MSAVEPPVVDEAEIIVVGSGPCGSACAAQLAERGRDVLLLDKDDMPRDKPCGDGLTRATVAALREMGLDRVVDSGQVIQGERLLVDFEEQRTRRYGERAGHGAACIPRSVLDEAMRDAAVERGARFRRARVDAPVVVDGSARGVVALVGDERVAMSGQYVVAADGATSKLRTRAGLSGRLQQRSLAYAARSYYVAEQPLDPLFEIFLPLEFEGTPLVGYGWIFPVSEHVANVGIGYFLVSGLEKPRSLRAALGTFVADLERYAGDRYGSLTSSAGVMGSPLAVDFDPQGCEALGMVFVGDAAGTTDPFTGEGIQAAIFGGQAIARRIDDAARTKTRVRNVGRVLARSFPRSGQDLGGVWRTVSSALSAGRMDLGRIEPSREPLTLAIGRMLSMTDGWTRSVRDTGAWAAMARTDAELASALEQLSWSMHDELETTFPFVLELAQRDFLSSGGPTYAATVLAAATAFGLAPGEDTVCDIALSVELMALAGRFVTQLRLTDGTQRQHLSNAYALMMADYALIRSARLIARTNRLDVVGAARFAASAKEMSAGLSLRNVDRFSTTPSVDRYVRSVRLFEGNALGFGCWMLARHAEADDETSEALATYGRAFGSGMRMARDAIGLFAGDEITGARPGEVLQAGEYSLAVIAAAERDKRIRRLLGKTEVTVAESAEAARSMLMRDAMRHVVDHVSCELALGRGAVRSATLADVERLIDHTELPLALLREKVASARYESSRRPYAA